MRVSVCETKTTQGHTSEKIHAEARDIITEEKDEYTCSNKNHNHTFEKYTPFIFNTADYF